MRLAGCERCLQQVSASIVIASPCLRSPRAFPASPCVIIIGTTIKIIIILVLVIFIVIVIVTIKITNKSTITITIIIILIVAVITIIIMITFTIILIIIINITSIMYAGTKELLCSFTVLPQA